MDGNCVSTGPAQTFPIIISSTIQYSRFLHSICIALGVISHLEIKVCWRMCTTMLFYRRDLSIHSPVSILLMPDNKGPVHTTHYWIVFFQVGEIQNV